MPLKTRKQVAEKKESTIQNKNITKLEELPLCSFCGETPITLIHKSYYNNIEKCPCILTACKTCSDKSYDEPDEYCCLDTHESFEDFKGKEKLNNNDVPVYFELGDVITSSAYILNVKDMYFKIQNFDCLKYLVEKDVEDTNIELIELEEYNELIPKRPSLITMLRSRNSIDKQKINRNMYSSNNIIKYFLYSSIALLSYLIWQYNPTTLPNLSPERSPCTDKCILHFTGEKFEDAISNNKKQSKDLWATLKVGIKSLIQDTGEATTILLLHKENSMVECDFLNEIKRIANNIRHAKYILNEMEIYTPKVLEEESKMLTLYRGIVIDMAKQNLKNFDNPGKFIEKYKDQLDKDKLMIVLNFHKAPLNIMKAFHYLSDEKTPFVKNVLLILTLEVKNKDFKEKEIEIAESELKEILRDLDENIRNPLITRLTSNVVKFENEGRHSDCTNLFT